MGRFLGVFGHLREFGIRIWRAAIDTELESPDGSNAAGKTAGEAELNIDIHSQGNSSFRLLGPDANRLTGFAYA